MSRQTVVVSDISGDVGASSVRVGFGDAWYEVDVTEAEGKELRDLIGTYTRAGRKVAVAAKFAPPRKEVPETTAEEREAIRRWALENGFEINLRGRIPKKIFKAYQEARELDSSKSREWVGGELVRF